MKSIPKSKLTFPSDGFECGISVLPRISFSQIGKYLTEDVEIRKKLATEKPIEKGYRFYKSVHVRQMFTKKDENDVLIKKSVYRPSHNKSNRRHF